MPSHGNKQSSPPGMACILFRARLASSSLGLGPGHHDCPADDAAPAPVDEVGGRVDDAGPEPVGEAPRQEAEELARLNQAKQQSAGQEAVDARALEAGVPLL